MPRVKTATLAMAALMLTGPQAGAALLPDEDDDQWRFDGTVEVSIGAQSFNDASFSPTDREQAGDREVASRKLRTLLQARRPGRYLLLFDGEWEQLPLEGSGHQHVTNQLYGVYDYSPQLKLRLGKQRVLWGHGFAYIPTDFINPPLDPTGVDLAKPGVEALSFDYFGETHTVTGILTHKEDGEWGAGVKVTSSAISGFDYNLVYYYDGDIGHAAGATFSADPFQEFRPELAGLIVHGGIAIQQNSRYPGVGEGQATVNGQTVEFPRVDEPDDGPFLSGLLGLSYEWISSRVGVSGEYYYIGDAYGRLEYDEIVQARSDLTSPRSGLSAPWGDFLVYGRNQRHYLSLSFSQRAVTDTGNRFTDNLSYEAGYLTGLGDGSGLVSAGLTSAYWSQAGITLRGFVPVGESDSEFGTMPFDWYVEALIEIGF